MGITCVEQSQRIIFNVEWTGIVTLNHFSWYGRLKMINMFTATKIMNFLMGACHEKLNVYQFINKINIYQL